MEHEVKAQAKKAIETLYGWLFDGPAYDPFSSASSATACVKNYESVAYSGGGAGSGANGDAGGFFGGYAEKLQDKVAAVVSTASSVAANAAASYISGVAGNGNGAAGGVDSNSASRTKHVASHAASILANIGGRSSSSTGGGSDHSLHSTLQSFTHPEFWQQLSPSSVMDRIAEEVQTRFGLNHWAETLNLEPHILLMLLLLPLFLLFLTTCLCMGAGHTSEEDRPHYPGQRTDPAQISGSGNKQVQGSSSSSKQGGGSSSTSFSTGKGGKNRQGSKKGGTQDNAGSVGQQGESSGHQNQLGNSNGVSSWAALLGSTGLLGAEAQSYKPTDIFAGFNQREANKDQLTAKEGSGSAHGASGDVTESHPAQTLANETTQNSRRGSVVHGEGIVSTIMEDIVGQSDAQQEQSEIGIDNREEYVNEDTEASAAAAAAKKDGRGSDKEHRSFTNKRATKSDMSTSGSYSPSWKPMAELHETNSDYLESHQHIFAPGTQQSQQEKTRTGAGPGAVGPGSDCLKSPTTRTRSPRPRSFKEADRHRHQPHISSRSRGFGETKGSSPSSRLQPEQEAQHPGFASKMMVFAQESQIWQNLDGISGGVLGATLATVAMLTNTVEAATSTLKGNIPQSWAELSEELKDSFDEALNQGVEGSGIDQDDGWGFSKASGKAPSSTITSSSLSSTTSSQPSDSSASAHARQPNTDANSKVSPFISGGASEKSKQTSNTPSVAPKDNASTNFSSTASAHSSNAPANVAAPASKEQVMATSAPRLRQRSVAHGQPGLAIATATATAAATATTTPVSADADKTGITNATSTPNVTSNAAAPAPIATSKSVDHPKLSVEDISVARPALLLEQKSKTNAKSETPEPGSATPTLASTQRHFSGILGTGQAGSASEKAKDNIAESIGLAQSPTSSGSLSPSTASTASTGLNVKEVVSKIDAIAAHNVAQSTLSKNSHRSTTTASQGVKKSTDKSNSDRASTSPSNQTTVSSNKSKKSSYSNVSTFNQGPTSLASGKQPISSASFSSKTATVTAAAAASTFASTAASNVQKVSHKAPAQIKKAAEGVKKTVDSALKKTDHVVQQVTDDAKHVAKDASKALSEAKGSAVKNENHVAHDASKALSEAKDSATKKVDHVIKQVTGDAKHVVHDASKTLSKAKDSASKKADNAVKRATETVTKVDSAARHEIHDVKAIADQIVDQTEEFILQAAHGAHATLGKTIHQAIETVDAAVESAQKAKKNAVTAVQNTVSSIEGTVSGAVQSVPKAVHDVEAAVFNATQKSTDAATKSLQKSVHDAREVAEGAVARAKGTMGSAVGAAQKAKETIGFAVGAAQKTKDAVMHGAQETVKQAESATKNVAQGARKSVDGAIGSAYQAKDAAMQAAQGAVLQAKANVDSAVGAAKNVIVQNVVTPVRQAEQMIETAVEIGRGTVEAAVQGAREASEKLEQESKRAARKSSHAAKTAMDNAIATAHQTEDHVAKNLKTAATKAETTAQKANHDVKSVLDSAPAKAHKTEENVAKGFKRAATKKSIWPVSSSASGQSKSKDLGPSKKKASPTLDHDNYVYKNKDGDRVGEEEADDDSDDNEGDDNSKGAGGSSIFGSAPSIIHQAKVAAGAIVARMADVGYENFDSAKHTIEDMVDNFTENIAGHELPEENEEDDDEIQRDSLNRASNPSSRAELAQAEANKSSASVNASVGSPKKATSESSSISSGRSSSPSTQSNRGVFGTAQNVVSDATDSLADVADNVSEMITGAKSSASRAMKEVKEIAAEAVSRGNSPTPAHAHVIQQTSASPTAAKSMAATGRQQASQSLTKSAFGTSKEKSAADSKSSRDSKVGGNNANTKHNKINHGNDSGSQSTTKKNTPKNTAPSSTPAMSAVTLSSGIKAQESSSDSGLKDVHLAAAVSHTTAKIPEDGHAYKPNLKSQHYDKDGFIIVEDPDSVQETEKKSSPSSVSSAQQAGQHSAMQKKLQPRDPKHLHIDTPAVSRPESAASHRSSMSSVHHTGTEPGLSYSGAVQLNVDENDHGAVVGVSQILIPGPPQPLHHSEATRHQSGSLFSSENFVIAPAANHGHLHHDPARNKDQEVGHLSGSIISRSAPHAFASEKKERSLNPLLQHVIHPHDARQPQLSRGVVGTGAPATTTLSFEHGHGELQGVISKKGSKTKTKHGKHGNGKTPQQEFTIDQQGNKVPVVDAARRDSGFDLLM